jgi:hypothetical protein
VVALLSSVLPASADSGTTTALTPDEQATQTNVENLLSGLQGVLAQVNSNAITAGGLQSTGTDPTAMINAAQQQVSNMSGPGLDQLQSALNADPNWQQIPQQLSGAVNQFATAASKVSAKDFSGTFTDSCAAPPDGAYDEFTATEVANEVQSAAQAAMLAAPGVIAVFIGVDVPTGVKIALAVIWGVANAVFLALSQTLAVAADCNATNFSNLQTSLFPTVDANGSTTDPSTNSAARASSEASVLALIAEAGSTSTEINNVNTTVTAVDTQASNLVTSSGNLDSTLAGDDAQVVEIQTDVQTLQADVGILNNTLSGDLGKADHEIANLSTFQALQLRIDIEENLMRNGIGSGAVGLYELPMAKGGYLELVRTIVTNDLAAEAAVKGPSATATSDLNTANTDFTAGQYKTAYQYYTKAYHDAR